MDREINLSIKYFGVDLKVTGYYCRGCKATRIDPPEPECIEDLCVYDSGDAEITEILTESQLEKIEELAIDEVRRV